MPFLPARFLSPLRGLFVLPSNPGCCKSCGASLSQLFEAVELNPDARLEGRVVYCHHCRVPSLQLSLFQRIFTSYCKSCHHYSVKHEVAIEREAQAVRVGRVQHSKQCKHCTEEAQRILLIPRCAMPDAVVRRERPRKTSLGG